MNVVKLVTNHTPPKNFSKTCKFYKIPMSEFEATKKALNDLRPFLKKGEQFKYLFRGPRNSATNDTRSKYTKQSSCLKANAVYFSVHTYIKIGE